MLSFLGKFARKCSLAFAARPRRIDEIEAETDAALRALFDIGAAGVSEVDMATIRFVRVNNRFCEILRRPRAQLLQMGPPDVIHPDDLEKARAEWLSAMARDEQWEATVRHIGPAGETIWVRIGVTLWKRDANGAPPRCLAVLQDVSEALEATEKLRESEQFLRLSQEGGRIGSFTRDFSTGLIRCGGQMREIFGVNRGEAPLPTEVWMASVLPEDRPGLIEAMETAIRTRVPEIAYDYRVNRLDGGGLRHIEMRARYCFDAEGRPVSSVGVVIDVTERKLAEERLRANETQLRLSMNIGGIGAFKRDFTRGGQIECGPEIRALHGLPSGEAPIPAQTWLATLLPEDAERVVGEMRDHQKQRQQEMSTHYRFRREPDGPIRHMEARANYIYDEAGNALCSIGVVIDVTERKQAESQLAHAARHDALTGLPNRTLFQHRMEKALARARRGEAFALLCLDLDRFKEINDTLGHPVGDRLLIEAAKRLRAELRETDTLARLGGDEFAIVQTQLADPLDAMALARRLIETISRPFDIDGQSLAVGVSIGIALAPGDGLQHDDLLKAADMALYRAKEQGRGCWRCFEPEMNARMQMRRAVELDLRRALERGEFTLFYQPIVDVPRRRVKCFEALIRWRHPDRGLIPPDDFIPLVEESGLIVPLGAWVLRRACAEAALWPEEIGVAVNLSAAQFANRDLVETVAAALAISGLAPQRLELEITESVMLRDSEATLATLHRLKTLGVRIALDDFGTGYSSLSYLQSFPFDKVKIDRAFTQGLDHSRQSDAIVQAVSDICDGLDMCALAEGVETEEQMSALERRGCREAQGFLFSKPREAGDVPAMLADLGAGAHWTAAAE